MVGGDNSSANMQNAPDTSVDDRQLPVSTAITDKYDLALRRLSINEKLKKQKLQKILNFGTNTLWEYWLYTTD